MVVMARVFFARSNLLVDRETASLLLIVIENMAFYRTNV